MKNNILALTLMISSGFVLAQAQQPAQIAPAQTVTRQPVPLNAPPTQFAPQNQGMPINTPSQQSVVQAPNGQKSQQLYSTAQPTQSGQMVPNPGIPQLPVGEPIDIKAVANQGAVEQTMPLSAEDIRNFRKLTEEIKRERGARGTELPESVTTSLTVSFSPGEQQHVIRLGKDMVSTISFSDSTGQPWPVLKAISGSGTAIKIHEIGEGVRTNMIPISLLREYISTNLTVYLENASSPIVFTVVDAQKKVDSVIKASVRARGPLALEMGQMESVAGKALKKELITAMDGITPEGFLELKVNGIDETRVWLKEKTMIVRSKGKLLSPVSMKVFPSSDGTTVYETVEASSLIFSIDGKVRTAIVSGFRNSLLAKD